jgi:hypothetical protein
VHSQARRSRWRTAALVALGSFVVHQLRYLLAYGSESGAALAHQGHAYLVHAVPALIGFGFASLAAGVVKAEARRAGSSPVAASPIARSAVYGAAIALVFVVQESMEGLLAAGHPSGLGALFAAGGWLALPLSVMAGACCAWLDRAVASLEAVVAGAPKRRQRIRASQASPAPPQRAVALLPSLPMAFGLARRPPPLLR